MKQEIYDELETSVYLEHLVETKNENEIEKLLKIKKHKIINNREIAEFYSDLIKEICDLKIKTPTAHLILSHLYLDYENNYEKSYYHLSRAIYYGSDEAKWFMGIYLLGNSKMQPFLKPHPKTGLEILKKLAKTTENTTVQSLSTSSAASYIVRNFNIKEISEEEKELVDSYSSDNSLIITDDYFFLALFYAGESENKNYKGQEYSKAISFLKKGAEQDTFKETKQKCINKLKEWGIENTNSIKQRDSKIEKKEKIKTISTIAYSILTLSVTSLIGLFALSIANLINSITLPIFLILIVGFLLFKIVKR